MMSIVNEVMKDSDIVFEESIGGVPIALLSMDDMHCFAENLIFEVIRGLRNSYAPDDCIPIEEIELHLQEKFGLDV
jgi:hypothetical protein